MSGINKNLLKIGIIFIILGALSFLLLLFKLPDWLSWVGLVFLALGVILLGNYALSVRNAPLPPAKNPPPAAQSSPASASDLLRNAQQAEPQQPLKERQPQQERAFPPNKDPQS